MKTCKKGLHQYSKEKLQCPECQKVYKKGYAKQYYCDNKDLIGHRHQQYKQTHKEQEKQRNTAYYVENKEGILQYNRQRYLENKGSVKQRMQQYYVDNKKEIDERNQQYQRTHRAKCTAITRKYQLAKINATPLWLTKDQLKQIERFYIVREWVQSVLGEPIEVDHMVPIQGIEVRGLHVPWNLQLLTENENIRKGNRCD